MGIPVFDAYHGPVFSEALLGFGVSSGESRDNDDYNDDDDSNDEIVPTPFVALPSGSFQTPAGRTSGGDSLAASKKPLPLLL